MKLQSDPRLAVLMKYPPLTFLVKGKFGNGKYLPISTTDWTMSVPSTATAFQSYSINNTPWNHWWRLNFSVEFIFCNFLKYPWNYSFLIDLWFTIETASTGISKVSWKVFLNIPTKITSTSTEIIFGSPNGTKKFSKSHHATWSNVFSLSLVAAPISNTVIRYRHVRILIDPPQSGMYPGYQKYRNTTLNGASESIVWSISCASREHEVPN